MLIFTANAFGQNQRKKRVLHNLPEVGDEVVVEFRKKNKIRNSRNRYANQEVSYRKKSKLRKRVTHDPEFENWANRSRKTKKRRIK